MKTWTLVWFLIMPPTEDGQVVWEYGQNTNMTYAECVSQLAEDDLAYSLMAQKKEIAGHEIYCRENE